MGFATLSAASSCASSSFLSASGTDLSALRAAISFLICSGGWVKFLVCGSMPDMIIVIFVDTSSYSARLVKPFFLARAAACASTFGSGLSDCAIVEFRHVLVGGHEVLNQLLGKLDLVHLLRSRRVVMKQSESQKCREQRNQNSPTISNERHGIALRFDARLHSTIWAAA